LRGIRHRTHTESIFLSTLGLIELHGDDLRHDPLAGGKATLEMILAKAGPGIRFNEHIEGDGATVFRRVQAKRRRNCLEAEGLPLSFWPLTRLAQNEELRC
jgi:hypothetical protein